MRTIRNLIPVLGAAALALGVAAPAAHGVTLPRATGVHVATATPTSSSYSVLEGGTTDGSYWYSAVLHNTHSGAKYYSSVELLKTPLNGSKPVKTASYPLRSGKRTNLLGHANDMAYNPRTKQLIIPAAQLDNSVPLANQGRTLRLVDPRTLRIVRSVTIARSTTAICYDPTDNRYLGRSGSSYYVYNGAFALTSTFRVAPIAGVAQGIDCDQSYVYVIRTPDKNLSTNLIHVFTWSGKPVTTYEYHSSSEGEELLHTAGVYFYGINLTGQADKLYRLDRFQYTVSYTANHGTGSMAPTVVLYGRSTPLRANAFTRPGYRFAGWTAYRSVDRTYLYANPRKTSEIAWRRAGHQPSGWTLARYGNKAKVVHTTTRGTVTLSAVWTAA